MQQVEVVRIGVASPTGVDRLDDAAGPPGEAAEDIGALRRLGLVFLRDWRVLVYVSVAVAVSIWVVAPLRFAALPRGLAQVLSRVGILRLRRAERSFRLRISRGLERQAADRINRGYSAPLRRVVLFLVIGFEGVVLVQPRD